MRRYSKIYVQIKFPNTTDLIPQTPHSELGNRSKDCFTAAQAQGCYHCELKKSAFVTRNNPKPVDLRNNVGPSDQTPVLLNSATDGDLLANFRAGGTGQAELSGISLDTEDLSTSSGRTDVNHQDFVLGKLGNLGLLAVGGLDTQQAAEQEVVDLNLSVDSRKAATVTENETDKTICTAKRGVDTGTNTNQTTRNGKLEVIVLSEERHNAGENGSTLDLALLILGDETGADLNLIVQLYNTGKDGTTGNTTLELINLGTGLVDIEGTNDHHVRRILEVADGDRNRLDKCLVDSINVVLQLRGNGDNGRAISNGTTDELENRLVVLKSVIASHEVNCLFSYVSASFHRPFTTTKILPLFWRMMMWLSFIISMAAKCSEVCGCGQVSFPAIKRRAAS